MIANSHLDRRSILKGIGSAGLISGVNAFGIKRAAASRSDPRLAVIILRGALDGLAAVTPIDDKLLSTLRPGLIDDNLLPLDGAFALNSSLPKMQTMFKESELSILHATASPYRGRSHFDGQDILETALADGRKIGWLNRLAGIIGEQSSGKFSGDRRVGIAFDYSVPMILRGPVKIETWSQSNVRNADDDLVARVVALYDSRNPKIADALAKGAEFESNFGGVDDVESLSGLQAHRFSKEAYAAGKLLASEHGPRVASLSFDGWDTHFAEGAVDGRLSRLLTALDDALGAMKVGLGAAWKQTVVLIVTEFGRTVRINGTSGTDHGTATVAFLAGGAVKGGRVLGQWPGLTKMFEDRDLMPTSDIRSLFKGVLYEHLGVQKNTLEKEIFPDSADAKAFLNLVHQS